MEFQIDTNAVLDAVLASVSDTAQRLRLPLLLPLDRRKVTKFATFPVLAGRPSSLRSELEYEGGYEFRHQDSICYEFKSPENLAEMADREDQPAPIARDTEGIFANVESTRLVFKQALVRLGHTNTALLDQAPQFRQSPLLHWGWSAAWRELNSPNAAAVEVDPNTHAIRHYWLSIESFGREPWPTTLTHSQVRGVRLAYARPDWTALRTEGMDRTPVIALVQRILPEAGEFCRALGPPYPAEITEVDLVLTESKATMHAERMQLSLKLRSGVTVDYYKGFVYRVTAPDSRVHEPQEDGIFRSSAEYTNPVSVNREEAAAKVLRVAVQRLGLPRLKLGLDASPHVESTMAEGSPRGLRRYLVSWDRPETEDERNARILRRLPRESALSAEVDAVTGTFKQIYIRPSLLECPDPVVLRATAVTNAMLPSSQR